MRKGSSAQLHPTEYSLEGTGTKSPLHHTAFAPLPTGPPGFPWGAELTCCGKRVLGAEVQSQDAEQQAWNGVGTTETTTSAAHFTHNPKSLPSSTGSSPSKHQIQLPPASLEQGGHQFPSGRSRGAPQTHLRSGTHAGCRGPALLQKDRPTCPEPRRPAAIPRPREPLAQPPTAGAGTDVLDTPGWTPLSVPQQSPH